jgi:hypothetical protein
MSESIHEGLAHIAGRTRARKKAAVASGPKFREETPKKGMRYSDAIAISHCKI